VSSTNNNNIREHPHLEESPRKRQKQNQEMQDLEPSYQTAPNGSTLTNSSVSSSIEKQQLLIDNNELVRLIMQSLWELGYSKSCEVLQEEAGVLLQSPAISNFQKGVLQWNWALVETTIADLELNPQSSLLETKFLIYEQKFLELLEQKKLKKLFCV